MSVVEWKSFCEATTADLIAAEDAASRGCETQLSAEGKFEEEIKGLCPVDNPVPSTDTSFCSLSVWMPPDHLGCPFHYVHRNATCEFELHIPFSIANFSL